MVEAGRRDLVAIAPAGAPGQRAAHRLLTRGLLPQVGQHATGVQDRGGFDDAGDHQVTKGLVPEDPEPQGGVDLSEHLEQQPRRRAGHLRGSHTRLLAPPAKRGGCGEQSRIGSGRDQLGLARGRVDAQVELALSSIAEQPTGLLDQETQLGLGVRRTDVRHDPPASVDVLSDLHSRRTRGRPNPPHPRHRPSVKHQLVPQIDRPAKHHRRSAPCAQPNRERVTEVRFELRRQATGRRCIAPPHGALSEAEQRTARRCRTTKARRRAPDRETDPEQAAPRDLEELDRQAVHHGQAERAPALHTPKASPYAQTPALAAVSAGASARALAVGAPAAEHTQGTAPASSRTPRHPRRSRKASTW
ncbi:hypothetical protein EV648_12524 [Kribbella sp. VKM Ac-2568]|nr:hypothetical protein EV648_12524 [Kribbella sp. VKM Ac-2568]